MNKHTPTEIDTKFGDDSLFSTCENCNLPIELQGVYDDDCGVRYAKNWAYMTYRQSERSPEVRVGIFNTECLPVLN